MLKTEWIKISHHWQFIYFEVKKYKQVNNIYLFRLRFYSLLSKYDLVTPSVTQKSNTDYVWDTGRPGQLCHLHQPTGSMLHVQLLEPGDGPAWEQHTWECPCRPQWRGTPVHHPGRGHTQINGSLAGEWTGAEYGGWQWTIFICSD